MSSFDPGGWRSFSRPDQICLRRLLLLDLSRSHSFPSNSSLPLLLLLADIDGSWGEGDVEEEDGAFNVINSNGGNSGRGGFVYEGDLSARVLATDTA